MMDYLTRLINKWRNSTAMLICLVMLLIPATAILSPLWAADCTPLNIGLYTQADVDNFQNNHGPCDRALTIYIEGADIGNLDGLSSLTNLSRLIIVENDALTSLDGLSRLTSVWRFLGIQSNMALSNVDGLSGLTYVGSDLDVRYNDILDQCAGLSDLLDQWDDAEPGPGAGGVPDVAGEVLLGDNLTGCNSIEAILARKWAPGGLFQLKTILENHLTAGNG